MPRSPRARAGARAASSGGSAANGAGPGERRAGGAGTRPWHLASGRATLRRKPRRWFKEQARRRRRRENLLGGFWQLLEKTAARRELGGSERDGAGSWSPGPPCRGGKGHRAPSGGAEKHAVVGRTRTCAGTPQRISSPSP